MRDEKYLTSTRARAGFHPSQRSLFLPPPLLLYYSIHLRKCVHNPPTLTHKRAETVTIPTERDARVRIIFIRHGKRRGLSFGLSLKKRVGAIRRIQIGSGSAARILLEILVRRKTLGLRAIKRRIRRIHVRGAFGVHERRTNPSLNRVASCDVA